MPKAICPSVAGGLCAFGMLAADVRQSYLTTFPTNTALIDISRVNEVLEAMESQARSELRSQGFAEEEIAITRFMDAKYPYQLHEILVPVPSEILTDASVRVLADAFHDEHERLYTYCLREMPVDMNGWRVTAIGRLPTLAGSEPRWADGPAAVGALKGSRPVYFRSWVSTARRPCMTELRCNPA